MKKPKVRLIQMEFYPDPESDANYMTIVELEESTPVRVYTFLMPLPYTILPRYPFIKN